MEHIKLQQTPDDLILGGAFLLDASIKFLQEHVNLGTKLPSSNEAFEDHFATDFIKKYLGYYDSAIYDVS